MKISKKNLFEGRVTVILMRNFEKRIREIDSDNRTIQMVSLSFLYQKNCENETEFSK